MNTSDIKNKPTVEQLCEIMAMGVLLGKDQGKLKKIKNRNNSIGFFPNYQEIEPERGDWSLNNVYRYIGKISRTGFNKGKLWSMQIAEGGYLFDGSDMVNSYRTNFMFEWTETEVLKSKRVVFHPDSEPREFSVLPEQVDEIMFEADSLHAVNQFQFVSRPELQQLAARIRDFKNTAEDLSYNK